MGADRLMFLASFIVFAALTFWFHLFAAQRIKSVRKRVGFFLANPFWFFEKNSFRDSDNWVRWVGGLLNISFWFYFVWGFQQFIIQ